MVSEPSIRGISSMKMVWATHGGSSCGQCPDQYGGGVHGGGARHLFDEMPSHREATLRGVLRVTVSQVLYPMNEEVLHQVFDAYGAEQVVVLKRADHVEALVRFRSSRDAERARDVTHGRCVYDGCCWLDVQYMQLTPSDSVVATPVTCSTLGLSHNTDDITWDEEPKASPSPEVGTHVFEQGTKDHPDISNTAGSLGVINVYECSGEMNTIKESGENIYYDCPLREQTGIWVPPSVPPMTKHDHEEWKKGFVGSNGGYFPEEEYKWDIDEENKEMAMWDVLAERVVAGKDKVLSIASYDFGRHSMSLISDFFLQEVLKDKAQTLVDASAGSEHALLETEPTKWLPDSAAPSCMLCGAHFHPIICSRHHCHFCGGIFCAGCSKGRSLMPPKFRTSDPHKVCDVCGVRLECIQPYLMNQISRACQLPTNDLTDLSTLRSWLNFPWAHTMEYEIYKAANSIHGYCKVGKLTPEKSIPDSILRQAKGLAIITVVKVGMLVTYKIGTGLVVAHRADGSWSPPSAISTCGVGYGAQAGGEIADFIIVLRNTDAIKTFSGNAHLSVGAGISASAGHLGRVAEADFRAGDGGYAACYTYSCSKGAFVGCALNGSVVSTRNSENARFYGGPIKASEILLGSLARPPAAATLYKALSILFAKIEN